VTCILLALHPCFASTYQTAQDSCAYTVSQRPVSTTAIKDDGNLSGQKRQRDTSENLGQRLNDNLVAMLPR
jgi:hypothetical protein